MHTGPAVPGARAGGCAAPVRADARRVPADLPIGDRELLRPQRCR